MYYRKGNNIQQVKSLIGARKLEKDGYTILADAERLKYVKLKQKGQSDEEMREYIANMDMIQVYFSTVSNPGGSGGFPTVAKGLRDAMLRQGIYLDTVQRGQDIALHYHHPQHYAKVKENKHTILYTMFESTKAPDYWRYFMPLYDEIWTPSHFASSVFRNQFKVESEVIPHGVDARFFMYKERPAHKVFTALMYNAFDDRKGWRELVDAWDSVFHNNPEVKLIMKGFGNTPNWVGAYSNIQGIVEDYSPEQIRELLYQADLFVFPSKGEGFGNTPVEAMCTGIPALIPNAHGIATYFDARYCYEVETYDITAKYNRPDYSIWDLGTWKQPSKESIKRGLIQAFREWKSGGNQWDAQWTREISGYASQYSYDNAAIMMAERIKARMA